MRQDFLLWKPTNKLASTQHHMISYCVSQLAVFFVWFSRFVLLFAHVGHIVRIILCPVLFHVCAPPSCFVAWLCAHTIFASPFSHPVALIAALFSRAPFHRVAHALVFASRCTSRPVLIRACAPFLSCSSALHAQHTRPPSPALLSWFALFSCVLPSCCVAACCSHRSKLVQNLLLKVYQSLTNFLRNLIGFPKTTKLLSLVGLGTSLRLLPGRHWIWGKWGGGILSPPHQKSVDYENIWFQMFLGPVFLIIYI